MLLCSTSYGKKKYHTICLFSIHLSLSRIKKYTLSDSGMGKKNP